MTFLHAPQWGLPIVNVLSSGDNENGNVALSTDSITYTTELEIFSLPTSGLPRAIPNGPNYRISIDKITRSQ